MPERVVDFLLDESKWLLIALLTGAALAGIRYELARRAGADRRDRVGGALSLLFAGTIGTMGLGHLLAVSLTLARGGLQSSYAPVALYAIGLALVLPAAWIGVLAWRSPAGSIAVRRRLVALHVVLAAVLLALGLHNAPLAAPAVLNVAYLLHTRRAVGRAAVLVAAAVYALLLVGATRFFLSGQSFEQFTGM